MTSTATTATLIVAFADAPTLTMTVDAEDAHRVVTHLGEGKKAVIYQFPQRHLVVHPTSVVYARYELDPMVEVNSDGQ